MKSRKIAAWSIFFLLIAIMLFNCFLEILNQSSTFRRTNEGRLLSFDRILQRYRLSLASRPILTGPSYVSDLGDIPFLWNLGIPSANPREVNWVLGSSKGENVLYFSTLRDAWKIDEPPQEVTMSDRRRWKAILSKAFDDSPSTVMPQFDAEILIVLRESLPSEAMDNPKLNVSSLIGQIRNFGSATEEQIDACMDWYKDLSQTYELTIIIYPLLPLKRVQPSSQFAKDINNFIDKSEKLKWQLKNSGLHILDLSNSLPNKEYTDLVHLSPLGRETMKNQLAVICARSASL